jgi:hypothetical protein
LSTESKLFGALVLLVGVAVVAAVAWDLYVHPPDPDPVGTAIIKVSGGSRFTGTVGTVRDQHGIRGTTAVALTVPYRKADYVMAEVNGPEAVEARIYVEYEVREEGETLTRRRMVKEGSGTGIVLAWKPPPEER